SPSGTRRPAPGRSSRSATASTSGRRRAICRSRARSRSRRSRVRRRTFLQLVVLGGAAMAHSPRIMAGTRRTSPYGRWVSRHGVPAFVYDADQETLPGAEWDPIIAPRTRRNWLLVGNTAIRMQGANDGTVAFFDESEGLRWLVAPDPGGSGVSVVTEADGRMWGTDY